MRNPASHTTREQLQVSDTKFKFSTNTMVRKQMHATKRIACMLACVHTTQGRTPLACTTAVYTCVLSTTVCSRVHVSTPGRRPKTFGFDVRFWSRFDLRQRFAHRAARVASGVGERGNTPPDAGLHPEPRPGCRRRARRVGQVRRLSPGRVQHATLVNNDACPRPTTRGSSHALRAGRRR